MKKVIVLGAGRVGQTMAIDLCKEYAVTSVDFNAANLATLSTNHPIETKKADLSDPKEIEKAIQAADIVIGAVPGFMGFEMVKTVLNAGKNIVDISFFNEDIFLLDELAKKNNVVAVMDCGVAPGMDNIILGYHNKRMTVQSFECLVGGLPVVRSWPYEYKAPFSPIDVIAEYTRPARFVKEGKLVTRPALSDPELIDFPQIGTLEAFNTDGLRSLIKTMKIPDMIERTLRYPGHINYMRVLRESGFFSEEIIQVNGKDIRPIDLTSKLLFPMWKLKEGEEEFTIMRVVVKGIEDNKPKTYTYDLLDRYDRTTKTPSMSRTTGYTCTAVARLVLENKYTRIGISPPEFVGEDENCFRSVLADLKERGVEYCVSG
ncbi:MAG: saccharopine dehydrogenase NADP-binding domain-containing protein [Bacteroidetes bacterium]|nr:saccharopine dehydrogenase NADP-binding domain-containing protein [Bacteroidota bacterium]MBK9541428.1 saccharopine dehydrogenase NADP-binding domain-containing protein [Bacteroidota bacterium]MBP6649607.1 saccharopine dehydrogenase NADP-binding domain-containing protein [Bacteroidia bacterium]